MDEQEPEQELDKPSQEHEDLAMELYVARRKYMKVMGTYKEGYWKNILENRVRNSKEAIDSLIEFYEKFHRFTPEKEAFARRMVQKAALLGVSSQY